MIILPAIDLKDGNCVRLLRGDYATAHKVAEDPVKAALSFQAAGAQWLHMVDLDGAKDGSPKNRESILQVCRSTNLKIEIGGGIREMKTVSYYLEHGISRVILGSAAVKQPEFVKQAVREYGERIAVGIDARDGMVAAEGWLQTSEVSYLDLAKQMEDIGVKKIIFTDISQDGTLAGPNLAQLDKLNQEVCCDIIASGGVANSKDIINLKDLGVYGAICGKAVYTGDLDLREAIAIAKEGERMIVWNRQTSQCDDGAVKLKSFLDQFFQKANLIPAIVQEESTGEVLMLAYMDRESLRKTFETGYTWFYSRSRQELWNKGATSGHLQKVMSIHGDCDQDTLLVKVQQTGAACHTGSHSCFFQEIWRSAENE